MTNILLKKYFEIWKKQVFQLNFDLDFRGKSWADICDEELDL